eukprot:1690910-Rhodomonas_salina.1
MPSHISYPPQATCPHIQTPFDLEVVLAANPFSIHPNSDPSPQPVEASTSNHGRKLQIECWILELMPGISNPNLPEYRHFRSTVFRAGPHTGHEGLDASALQRQTIALTWVKQP